MPNFQHMIVHQFDPDADVFGGVAGYIADFIRVASSLEHKVGVIGITRRRSVELNKWRRAHAVETESGAQSYEFDFLPVARADTSRQLRRIPHSVSLAAGLFKYRPNVSDATVYTHRAEIGAIAASMFRQQRRVLYIHGSATDAFAQPNDSFWRALPAAYFAVQAQAVRRSDRVWVMHQRNADALRGRFGDHVRHSASGFDGEVFNLPPGQRKEKSVGWVGRFETPKDPVLAIEAINSFLQEEPSYAAWVAGDGALGPQVRAAVHASEHGERIELLGHIGPAELGKRLAATSLVVNTSAFEGSPRGVLEALACGVAVVAPDVGDIRGLMGTDDGIVVAKRDARSVSDALVEAARHDWDARAIAARAEKFEARSLIAVHMGICGE